MLSIEEQAELRKKIRTRKKMLPDWMEHFIDHVESEKSISTTYEYLKDLHLFCCFIKQEALTGMPLPTTDVSNLDITRIDRTSIIDFLIFLDDYARQFKTTAGNMISQHFQNTSEGKNRKLSTLKSYFAYCHTQGWVKENIAEDIDLAEVPSPAVRNRLTHQEVARLFAAIQDVDQEMSDHERGYAEKVMDRDLAIFTLLIHFGLKVSECTGLNVENVFIANRTIVVARRNMPMAPLKFPPNTFSYIEKYYNKRVQERSEDENQPLFLSIQDRRIHPKTIRLLLEKYRLRAGIEIRVTPQVLRRTFAHAHYQKEKDIADLAHILGAKSLDTVQRYYLNIGSDRL